MKKITCLLLLFYGINSYAVVKDSLLQIGNRSKYYYSEKDSLLRVYLEKSDSLSYGFNLVFENTTSDTIMLFNRFEDFRYDVMSHSGFNFLVYYRKKFGIQIHQDEIYGYYHIPDNRFAKGRFVLIAPGERTSLSFSLLQVYTHTPDYPGELGIEMQVNYTFSFKKPEAESQYYRIKTNYLIFQEDESPDYSAENADLYSEADTLLRVYLEKNDSLRYGFNLVFENTTSDTISLFNRFRDFRYDIDITSGFNVFVYHRKEIALQIKDEIQQYYYLPYKRHHWKTFVLIPPGGKTRLSFSSLIFFSLAKGITGELGVQMRINYTYTYKDQKKINRYYWKKTNYLILQEEESPGNNAADADIYSEKDTPLQVYLEKNDTICYGFNLIFENTTSDTISLFSKFEYFRYGKSVSSGFNLQAHYQKEIYEQTQDDVRRYYDIRDKRYPWKRIILIPPGGRTGLSFSLFHYFLISTGMTGELGIQMRVKYMCGIRNPDAKSQKYEIETNYLILKEEGLPGKSMPNRLTPEGYKRLEKCKD